MTPPEAPRPLRADAARNRATILATARTVFAEHGLEVTMDDIARSAGLGTGTVYRRFKDRDALVDALFEHRLAATVAFAEECLQASDPWEGFVRLLTHTSEEMAGDRGLRELMVSGSHGQERVAAEREALVPVARAVVARARAAGTLRADVTVEDVPLVFLMMGTLDDFGGTWSPHLWRRFLEILLRGMRTDPPAASPLHPGLDDAQLAAAIAAFRPCRQTERRGVLGSPRTPG